MQGGSMPQDVAVKNGPGGHAPVLRIVADDLTGALDTAARFVPVFGVVPTTWSLDALPEGIIAIDSATRERPEAEACETAARLAPFLAGADLAFRKVDSLLRGHVAAELAESLPAFDHCVFAPAFPFQGRITRNGRQCMRDGGIVASGPMPVPMRDAETDADLERIVAEGRCLPGRVLWCGTAGLAGALAGRLPVIRPVLEGPILALIGSDHPVSHRQVALAPSARTVPVPADASQTQAAGIIAAGFAALLRDAARPGVLFVSGGETLRAVCAILGAHRLDVDGEIEPGVPTSLLRGGRWDGQRIVSKSGAFGDDGFLARLFQTTPGSSG